MNKTKQLYPTIQPIQYTITLKPDFDSFTFTGQEILQFVLEKTSQTLTLHAYELVIEQALVREGTEDLSAEIAYNDEEKTVTFTFSKELSSGEKTLEIRFSGLLSEKMKGFYRSQYVKDGEIHYLATTQFEEIGARQAFVCIDEPAAKAIFDITLIVPPYMQGISNTVPVEEKTDATAKTIHFSPTPKMSTYLVAFIVGEFESLETKTEEGVLVRAFCVPGKKEQLRFGLDVAAKALSFYQSYFAISYPLPVLDLIAIPDFDAGAMENWGAVTFRESALLIDEEKSSLANRQRVALVVAHELAHMWFGNLVTMQWWTYLWLNEGFACYIEYVAVDALFPQWRIWEQFAVSEHNAALALDGLKYTHPIEIPIENENAVKEIFDEISYAKGASVLQMLASFLGKDVFRDGLRVYLKRHAYGNTTTEDLWQSLEEVSNKPVGTIMHNWVRQPGYPVIWVEEKGASFELSQERFFSNPFSKGGQERWHIPFEVFVASSVSPQTILMDATSMQLAKEGDWIKINAQETAVLRALYTDTLYQLLGNAVHGKNLHAIDAMGLIRDAFAGAQAGLLSTVAALKLLPFFTTQDEYIVWSTIASGIHAVDNLIAHMPVAVQDSFALFVRELFKEIAHKVGWEKREGESEADILLRSIVLHMYGKYGDEETLAKAKALFFAYIKDGKPLDADIRGVVFGLVAEHGGEKEWESLVQLYTKESSQQEKNRIMLALCSFQDSALCQKTLEWVISGKTAEGIDAVRLQDKSLAVLVLFNNPVAQQLTWEFVQQHWEYFTSVYKGLHGFTRVIEGAGHMVGKQSLEEVKKFFAKHETLDLERTISQVIEQIEANTAWFERDKDAIADFLLEKSQEK